MNFDKSPFRSALMFRNTFIKFKHTSIITRQQVIFLAYLVETGHVKDFRTRSLMIKGLSWELANQYLNKLKGIGFASKNKRVWTVTVIGMEYYAKFQKEFSSRLQVPFFWR